MANDNNNINELVADDDDPTVELRSADIPNGADELLEADARTFDTDKSTDPDERQETIDQLQFDIESLRARSLGLEAEAEAREEQTDKLNDELDQLRKRYSRKEKLIKKRDGKIKALKSEIRQRDEEFRQLRQEFDELQLLRSRESTDVDVASDNETAITTIDADELQRRLNRSEKYADAVRQQAQDRIEANRLLEREVNSLMRSLTESREKVSGLSKELHESRSTVQSVQEQLDAIQEQHDEDIRILRFELGEAQNTVVESGDLNNQLTSDLIDARTFKEELERMLGEAEKQSSQETERLEREIRKLTSNTEVLEQKLSAKSEAITVLLAELAKKTDKLSTSGHIDDDARNSDEQVSGRNSDAADIDKQAPLDRVSRVLIGTVEGQVLRFPLFKDRLTIGRTRENDIQLKAAYISRQHAVIQTVGESTRIIDRGSKNGVQVNSEKISDQVLRHGDLVIIGNARFKYEERKKRD